jgi:hypothetical protein
MLVNASSIFPGKLNPALQNRISPNFFEGLKTGFIFVVAIFGAIVKPFSK